MTLRITDQSDSKQNVEKLFMELNKMFGDQQSKIEEIKRAHSKQLEKQRIEHDIAHSKELEKQRIEYERANSEELKILKSEKELFITLIDRMREEITATRAERDEARLQLSCSTEEINRLRETPIPGFAKETNDNCSQTERSTEESKRIIRVLNVTL